MHVTSAMKDGLLILTLKGRFDTFGAGPVQQAVDEHFQERPKAIIMDLSGVDFISSAGLRVLMIASRELEARKGTLALSGLNPYCHSLLQTIRVAGALPQFDNIEGAENFCRQKYAPPA